ncbi:hypothetical protein KR018_000350 [Drosophila ironensis]|nr:hypothetical protein KR018_000350 [Drosophila ironensis]
MAYETLMNTTYSPAACPKKNIYTPSKAVKKLFKVACKIFKNSGHQTLKNQSIIASPISEEEFQNSQNEQLEAELVEL